MTIDNFLRIFKKCPVCNTDVLLELTTLSFFVCDEDCLLVMPRMDDKKNVDMASLSFDNYTYEYYDGKMSIFECYENSSEQTKNYIECSEDMMIRMFSDPKNINKILVLQ